jgi:hypothetical protein
VCQSHRKTAKVWANPVELKMQEIMGDPDYLWSHERGARELAKSGARILTLGSTGWPDLLFEMHGRVSAAEVKAGYDRVRPYQRAVIESLRRLDAAYVIRVAGTKHDADEMTVSEVVKDIHRRFGLQPKLGS